MIYAADNFAAQEIAEDLCNGGAIDLNFHDFQGRETECRGIARANDLALHEAYDENGKVPPTRSLDEQVQIALNSGLKLGEVINNAKKTAMREGYEQFVISDKDGGYSFCRSAYGKPTVPMFDGDKILGKVAFTPNQRDVEFVPVGKDEGVKQKGNTGKER